VLAVFSSIRFYNMVPIYAYMFAPLLSIGMWFIIPMMFYPIVNVHDATESFLLEWKRNCAKNPFMKYSRKIWTREINALRPLRVGAGVGGVVLFSYKKSTRTMYY
jgi:hypothetical protein